jgi:hypothetical protein
MLNRIGHEMVFCLYAGLGPTVWNIDLGLLKGRN